MENALTLQPLEWMPSTSTVRIGIPTHDARRLPLLERTISALLSQGVSPASLIVAVDSNPLLQQRLANNWPRATIIATCGKGVSAARNTILHHATAADILLYLDDDVLPQPGWLDHMVGTLRSPGVAAVGGRIVPDYEPGATTLPPEVLWLVGCTYLGHPSTRGPITRPIGATMGFRRQALLKAGGFDMRYGPVGIRKTNSNEELALAQLLHRHFGPYSIWYEPDAVVTHFVPVARCTWRYLLHRSWVEGTSKSEIRHRSPGSLMEYDRKYLSHVLLRHAARYASRGELASSARLLSVGLVTGTAYITRSASFVLPSTPTACT